jgi:hypothetical protein
MFSTGEDVLWQFITASRGKNDTEIFRKITESIITRARKCIRTDKKPLTAFMSSELCNHAAHLLVKTNVKKYTKFFFIF